MIKLISNSLKIAAFFAVLGMVSCNQLASKKSDKKEVSLKDAFQDKFLIGAALNTPQIVGDDISSLKVVKSQFSSIVAENCMKAEVIHPKPGVYDFELSDQFVDFGNKNNMFVIGHTLVWHSQTPDWYFTNDEGEFVSRDEMIARMKDHIYTIVGRYKGKVHGWDVVNEAIIDDAGLRESKYFKIIGPDFIDLAFQFAHEADPDAELYYNDYNLYKPHKRNEVIKLVKNLKKKDLQIDGVGMQAHYGLDMDINNDIEESIVAFYAEGVKVMVTELDVSVLPFPEGELTAEVTLSYENKPEYNPFPETLPDSIQTKLANYYAELFKVYLKHSDKISRVTFWGVNDSQTWRNYWPINGRTDYPLFFDRDNQPKQVFHKVLDL